MQASERMVAVRISYKKLWMLLLERDIKKASLRHEVGLSAGTWTKLNKGKKCPSLFCCAFVITWTVTSEIYVRLCERTKTESGFSYSSFCWIKIAQLSAGKEQFMGNSVMLNGIEYAGEQIAYKGSTYEIVSKVAYLIGVPLRIFKMNTSRQR